jgi:glutamin-(asparagin-)ase
MVVEGKNYWFRLPAKRHTMNSEFDIEKIDTLPAVEIAYGSRQPFGHRLPRLRGKRCQGHHPRRHRQWFGEQRVVPSLIELRGQGVQIIRSSHVNAGGFRPAQRRATRRQVRLGGGARPQSAEGAHSCRGRLEPDSGQPELQRIFWEY